MSTLKADAVTPVTGNSDLELSGNGTGVVNLATGATLAGTALGTAATKNTGTSSGEIPLLDGTGLPAVDGSQLTGISSGFTSATVQATTSGTTKTFSGIPAGTSLIALDFNEVSFTTGVNLDVTIGDAGGLETSGYVCTFGVEDAGWQVSSSTAEFSINSSRTGNAALSGTIWLSLIDAATFTWIASGVVKNGTGQINIMGGSKALSAELTQLQISGGTFDAGSVNIKYS